jgi:RimJ/RimL family protein N-acetyltransferase
MTGFVITEPITTDRLALRPFTADDESDMLAFESLPEVARYLYNEPRTREGNALELARRIGQTALRQEGDSLVLAIDLDGTVIGYVLLVWRSETHQQGEFGYVLHPDYGGHGYATEAAVEALRLGFERLGLHRVIGRCDARNTASAALMERLGMRQEAHFIESEIFKGAWGAELHYAMLASEWAASRWAS